VQSGKGTKLPAAFALAHAPTAPQISPKPPRYAGGTIWAGWDTPYFAETDPENLGGKFGRDADGTTHGCAFPPTISDVKPSRPRSGFRGKVDGRLHALLRPRSLGEPCPALRHRAAPVDAYWRQHPRHPHCRCSPSRPERIDLDTLISTRHIRHLTCCDIASVSLLMLSWWFCLCPRDSDGGEVLHCRTVGTGHRPQR
jgi:hypothetical protein